MSASVRPEPDLDALIAARRRAVAPVGPTVPPAAASDTTHADLDAVIAQRRAALRGAEFTPGQKFGTEIAQGATLGFAPKILGGLDAVNSLLPPSLGGQGKSLSDVPQVYANTRDRIMRADTEAQGDSKIGSLATQMAGGGIVALPFAAASAARAALSGTKAEAPLLVRTAKALVSGATTGAAVGGVAGIGHATGGVGDYATQGLEGAAGGLALGGTIGAGTAFAGGLARGVVSKGLDMLDANRPVLRNTASLLDNSMAARAAEIDRVAPGGGSLVTAAVPEVTVGQPQSRLLRMLRGVGANPEAATRAEQNFLAQGAALKTARLGLGAQMGAIQGRIPLTDASTQAVALAQDVIAKHAPEALSAEAPTVVPAKSVTFETAQSPPPDTRGAVSRFWDQTGIAANRLTRPASMTTEQQSALQALERHGAETEAGARYGSRTTEIAPAAITDPGQPAGYDIQDMRDALSRLKFIQRTAQRSTNPNGAQLKDVNDAIDGIQKVLYQHSPDFAALDRDYAIAKGAGKQVNAGLKTVRASADSYAANNAYGSQAGSLGGSLPKGHQGIVSAILERLTSDRAAAADAVANLVTKPGGREVVTDVLNAAAGKPRLQIPANARLLQNLANLSRVPVRPGVVSGAAGGTQGRRLFPSP